MASYPNLRAEMKRYEVTAARIGQVFNRDKSTISAKMNPNSKAEFKISQAFEIRDRFFPDKTLDYLFSSEPEGGANG